MKNRKKQYLRSLKLAKKFATVAMLSATLVGTSTSLVKLTSSNAYAAEQPSRKIEKIPFKTETKEDPTLPKGEKKVIQKGVEGEKEIVTTIPSESQSKRKPVDVIVPYDVSGSTYGGTSELDHLEAVAKQGADDTRYLIIGYDEGNTPDGFALRKVIKGDTDSETKTTGARISKVTRFLSKQEILTFVKKVRELLPASHRDGSWSWDKAMKALKYYDPQYMDEEGSAKDLGTPYEEIFEKGRDKNRAVGILWFTDDWEGWEKYDTSFFEWAQKNYADRFLTVVYGGTGALSYNTLSKAGQKEILTTAGKDQAALAKEIADKFTKLVTITIPGKPVTTEKVIKEPVNEIIAIGTKEAESKLIPRGTQYKANPDVEAGKVKLLQEMVPDTETEGTSTETSTRLPQNVVVFTEASSAVGTVAGVRKAKDDDAPEALYPIVDKFQDLWKNMVKGDKLIFVVDENLPETFSGTVYVYEKGKDELSNKQSDIWKHRNEAATKAHGVEMFKAIGLKDDEIKRSDIRFDMDDLTTNDNMINGNPSLKAFITAGELLSVNLTKVDTPSLRSKAHTEASLKNANIKYTIGNAATITNPEVRVTSYHTKVQTPPKKVEGKDRIIEVGTKPTTSTEELAFKTIYRANEELEAGQKKVAQEGVKGSKSVTTSYSLKRDKDAYRDDETYKDINKVTADILDKKVGDPKIVEAKDEIIEVGTKPKVEKEKIPYQTIEEQDPTLAEGERKVKIKGVEGLKTTTTTYSLDEKTGEVTPSVKTDEEPKVDEVILVGTKKKAAQVKLRFIDKKSNKSLKDDEIVTNDKSKFGDEFSLKPEKELKVGKDLYRLVEIKLTNSKEDSKIEGLSEDKKSLTSKVTESEQSYDAVYERVVYTSYVDENGKELDKTVEGAQDKKEIKGYDFVKTEKSDNGDVKHIYKAKPIKGKTPVKYAETNEKSGVMYSILGLIGVAALAESIRRKKQSK